MTGTYVALKVLEPSASQLYEYIDQNNLPLGPEDNRALHSTVIWTKQVCPIKVQDRRFVANPSGLHVFHSNGKKRLVLLLDAPSLVKHHAKIKQTYQVKDVYGDFLPHVTLAYDIGEIDWWRLPSFKHQIILGEEIVRHTRTITKQEIRPWKMAALT